MTYRAPGFRSRHVEFWWIRGRNRWRAPDNGRPVGATGQLGYPQAMWMMRPILWRSRANLCTGRGTALWTNTQSLQSHRPDLRFLYPVAVQKKNFHTRCKITTNGAEESVASAVM